MPRPCSVVGCRNVHLARGYCSTHYRRCRKSGDAMPHVPIRRTRLPDECEVDGCSRVPKALGKCNTHYLRARRLGTTELPKREHRAKWRNEGGYVVLYRPSHPMSSSVGHLFEHRLVMAEHLGRALSADENVHHVNGDRSDNRIENLELWSTRQPTGQRVEEKVNWAVEMLRRYRPELLA